MKGSLDTRLQKWMKCPFELWQERLRLHREQRATFDVRRATFIEGINEMATKEHITRYCGSAAKATAASLEVCRKDVFLPCGGEANVS